MRPFLLLLGVSAVGKSTLINELSQLDERFCYIKPFTSRPLRENETEKIYKSEAEILELNQHNAFLFVNHLYGYTYATPREPIYQAIVANKFPLLDFPIQKLAEIKKLVPEVYGVYILPPDLVELIRRLSDRGANNDRLESARREIQDVLSHKLAGFDEIVTNHAGKAPDIAKQIYQSFIAQDVIPTAQF